MLKNNRTLENLLEPNCKIYLYLADKPTSDAFIQNAEVEGFTFIDGTRISEIEIEDKIALNMDKTINNLGFAGHMVFHNPSTSSTYLVRIDYKKYLAGEENYLYEPVHLQQEIREKKQPLPSIGDGTATILVYDKSIGMDCEFEKWLESEVFTYWRYSKGWYDGVCWIYVNLNSKLIARGISGIELTEPLCHHAVNIDEFKTIYSIFKKYEGLKPLEFVE